MNRFRYSLKHTLWTETEIVSIKIKWFIDYQSINLLILSIILIDFFCFGFFFQIWFDIVNLIPFSWLILENISRNFFFTKKFSQNSWFPFPIRFNKTLLNWSIQWFTAEKKTNHKHLTFNQISFLNKFSSSSTIKYKRKNF